MNNVRSITQLKNIYISCTLKIEAADVELEYFPIRLMRFNLNRF